VNSRIASVSPPIEPAIEACTPAGVKRLAALVARCTTSTPTAAPKAM
jgi:hypothetical protein